MRKSRLVRILQAGFGSVPDDPYFDGDMNRIRAYYDHRHAAAPEAFAVDEITWQDLSMDAVFMRINGAHSTSGEQYLYYLLRSPCLCADDYAKRKKLLDIMERDAQLRLRVQVILYRLGKRRAAYSADAFAPEAHGLGRFWLTLALVIALLCCTIGIAFSPAFAAPLLLLIFGNPVYHFATTKRLAGELITAQYSAALVHACQKISRLGAPALSSELEALYAAGKRTHRLRGLSGMTSVASNDLVMLLNNFLQLDLLAFELLKFALAKYRDDIALLHEGIGRLDASIAIASYRQSVPKHCDPELDFDAASPPGIALKDMVHPLVSKPVPNSAVIQQSWLLTGSNASGKSTFIKAVALNCLLAQSICTALCARYRGAAFRLYSSMAIADDVQRGDSYFIAEIKSLKRICDAAARGERILCVIDEVLRGTNTIERIAASSEVLGALASFRVLCIAATHDNELCALLGETFRLMHFEEQVTEHAVTFDYALREGPATSRNAIRLLDMLGYDPQIIARASSKAVRYAEQGVWSNSADTSICV